MILVTAPDIELARRLAKAALEAKLVACANIVPAIESHYWWEGKLESSDEVLIVFKHGRNILPNWSASFVSCTLRHPRIRRPAAHSRKPQIPRLAGGQHRLT